MYSGVYRNVPRVLSKLRSKNPAPVWTDVSGNIFTDFLFWCVCVCGSVARGRQPHSTLDLLNKRKECKMYWEPPKMTATTAREYTEPGVGP